MTSVDDRIVRMQFDNKQFESGVHTTLNSLAALKKGLDLSGIASGIESIASKFTTLGIMGVTALQNITNSAINAGKELIKSLTIDPISAGFADYNRKLTSVQTIMNATGKSIQTVSGEFTELDTYADKTIYNLDDMTSAFAKFTNAGIDSKKSIPAIKGIANMTALAGQDAGAASIAMYNLSQSLAGGFLTTMDYKSLNLANVATKEWKDTLVRTAIAAGTLVRNEEGTFNIKGFKEPLNDAQLFTEALSSGWANSDILLKVLGDYGNEETEIGKKAQSAAQDIKSFSMMMDTLKAQVGTGWTDTFEILVGNLTEAKALFTPLTNAVGAFLEKSAESRNELLKNWKAFGGRDVLIQGFVSAFRALESVLVPIGEAFREFFPPMTAVRLLAITANFKTFMDNLKMGEETAEKVKRIFRGFFAALDIGRQLISAVATGIGRLITALKPAGSSALSTAADFGDWLVALNGIIKTTDVFTKAVDKIATFVKDVARRIKEAIPGIVEHFQSFGSIDLSGLQSFSEKTRAFLEPLSGFLEGIRSGFEKVVAVVKKIATAIGGALGVVIDNLRGMFSDSAGEIDVNKIVTVLQSGLLTVIIVSLKKFIDNISGLAKEGTKFIKGITGILDGVKDSLKEYQKSLQAGTLLKIAGAIAILAAALVVLSLIDPLKLAFALGAITALFADLMGSMAVFNKVLGTKGMAGAVTASMAMIGMSTSILILAGALSKLAELEWDEIARGGVALVGTTALIVATSKIMNKNSKGVLQTAGAFLTFSVGISSLAKGLGKLSDVVIKLGVTEASLKRGLGALGILLGELLVFSKISKMEKMGVKQGVGMIAFALGLNVLADAVLKYANMKPEALTQGLIAVGGLLTMMGMFLRATGNGAKMVSAAASLVVISGALLVLTEVLKKMATMSWEELARAGVALAGSLLIIAGAMYLMQGALPGAAALVVIAVALNMLVPALQALGNLSLEQIGIALLAMAGTFAVLGISTLLLAPLLPALIVLAAAIALLGVSAMMVGAGLLMFSAGLAALAVTGVAGSAALVIAVTAILGLIPYAMTMIGLGIIAFAGVIAGSYPILLAAFATLLAAIIESINTNVPAVVECLVNMVLYLLNVLVEAVPKIVSAGMNIILGFLRGVRDKIKDVVAVGIEIVLNFIDGIILKLPDIIDTAFKFIITFINGLAEAIRANTSEINSAVANLVNAVVDGFLSIGRKFISIGENIINGVIEGITNLAGKVKDAAVGVARGLVSAVEKFLGINSPAKKGVDVGMYLDQGIAGGLKKYSSIVDAEASNVGSTAVNSMSKAIAGISDSLSSDVDMNPTIRPVIDLTNIKAGSKEMDALFAKQQGISVATSTTRATSIAQDNPSVFKDQSYRDMRSVLTDLKDSFEGSFEKINETPPQINFNGTYSFSGKEDIDYFMNQAQLLVQRRKS